MEKIDKEEIFNKWVHQGTIEEINAFNKKLCSERVEIAFKQGLEYAEEYYLKQLEEFGKVIQQREEVCIELQQAKNC